MVQPNPEGRPRRSRPRRCEEQAPLVEPHVNTASDIILDGESLYAHFKLEHVFSYDAISSSSFCSLPFSYLYLLSGFPFVECPLLSLGEFLSLFFNIISTLHTPPL